VHNGCVAEDWRLTATAANDEQAREVVAALHEREVHDELRDELGGRIAVSSDGPHLFLYADTRSAARASNNVLREVLSDVGASTESHVTRWHPIEERWEDENVPLPDTEDERRAERERLDADEDAVSIATGVAQWEVRIELASHAEAEHLADELETEGRSVVRRWKFLLVGANDQDDAEELGRRLDGRGKVHVEPSTGVAWQLMPRNPFAVFGGIGG
jgi:hypothetical protein